MAKKPWGCIKLLAVVAFGWWMLSTAWAESHPPVCEDLRPEMTFVKRPVTHKLSDFEGGGITTIKIWKEGTNVVVRIDDREFVLTESEFKFTTVGQFHYAIENCKGNPFAGIVSSLPSNAVEIPAK